MRLGGIGALFGLAVSRCFDGAMVGGLVRFISKPFTIAKMI